ncbi:MAG: DNA polymerase IV [Pirellulaceae bacterium]
MIIHIDMDAFYASVEIRDNPSLRGKPVVVGGSPQGRGVVSAASYEARTFGIHSAMSAAQAVRLCPAAVFIRPRMDHYVALSREIREIFFRFTPLVEPLSLDEAFLDVGGSRQLFGPADEIARQIKLAIQDELRLTASAGVAPNKFVAKVASDLDKPDGLVVVPDGTIQEFMDPLSIRRVWGIGPQTEKRFNALGVSTVRGIRQLPMDVLRRSFGIHSGHFWRLSRGIDSRPVVTEHEARTISHESTFSHDISDAEALHAWLQELTEQVTMRMRKLGIKGRTLQIKVRFSNFRTITRSMTFDEYTFETRRCVKAARQLLDRVLENEAQPVRLLGSGVSNLNMDAPVQRTLFDDEERQKQSRIDETCDAVKQRFGKGAVRSGLALNHDIRQRRTPVPEDRYRNQDRDDSPSS